MCQYNCGYLKVEFKRGEWGDYQKAWLQGWTTEGAMSQVSKQIGQESLPSFMALRGLIIVC